MIEKPRATRWPPPRPFSAHTQAERSPVCPQCGACLPMQGVPRSADFDIAVCHSCGSPVVIDRSGVVEQERKMIELAAIEEQQAHGKFLKAVRIALDRRAA